MEAGYRILCVPACALRPARYAGLAHMNPVPPDQQQSLVARLTDACGGSYSPETRRKYYISGPQWAAAYEGHALFHAPTRQEVGFEQVIQKLGEIGIGY